MCLILFAYRTRPDHPLVVAANRDEFYARPSAPAHRWPDAPGVFAGRDEQAGGTWLGVSAAGRFAAVTNFSELPNGSPPPGSRGALVAEFLEGHASAKDYARAIEGARYQGFSLLLWDGDDLVYSSNRTQTPVVLPAGVHALANTHLDGSWPKAVRGKSALTSVVHGTCTEEALLETLADGRIPPDEELPARGRDLEFERRVAPIFISGPEYGTRASTAVIFEPGRVRFTEQSFGPHGRPLGRVTSIVPLTPRGAGPLA